MLFIKTGNLRQTSNALRVLANSTQSHTLQKLYSQSKDQVLQVQFDKLVMLQYTLKKTLQTTATYLQETALVYERVEDDLQRKANQLLQQTPTLKQSKQPFFQIQETNCKFTKRFHTSISKDKSILTYLKNGACVGFFAGFDALSYSIGKNMKYLQSDARLTIGKAILSGDAKVTLFDNKKFQPALHLEAEGKAALAEAKASLSIGNSYVHADGEASVGVGVVSGCAKAVINKEEITLKADVGAAAIRGEVKGSFSLFGIKITATGSAEAGAIGAGAEYSSKKGEFTFGSRISLLAGLGFKIKVNYD